jgi:hypothetical protein
MKKLMLTIFCGALCACIVGCSTHPAVNVPPDCQKWLTSYFQALKAKDTVTIQELSSFIPARDTSNMPAEGVSMMQVTKKQIASTLLQKIYEQLGDFRDYSIETCRQTDAKKGETAANMMGEGMHVEIICKTNYSKHPATESFTFYKGPDDPALALDAHSYSVAR